MSSLIFLEEKSSERFFVNQVTYLLNQTINQMRTHVVEETKKKIYNWIDCLAHEQCQFLPVNNFNSAIEIESIVILLA